MKAIYRIFIFTLLLGLMASCNREELALELTNVELSAIMESGAKTKTTLSGLEDGMYYPLWSAGDEIAVYVDGDSSPVKFTLKSGEESTEATFSGSRDGESYCAIYPFSAAEVMQNGTISLTLPQTQHYVAGSFGPDSYPMIAQGRDGVLNFKNLCAVMKVSIKGEAAIRSITLIAKDAAAMLSGNATVDANITSSPLLRMAEGGSNSVTLECSGIELSKDNATDFHFVIPAQTYKGGFEIVIDAYTEQITKTVSADLEFRRSQIRHLKGMELQTELPEINYGAVPDNEIWYKTIDESVIAIKSNSSSASGSGFNASVILNKYENGIGKIIFDAPLTTIKKESFRNQDNLLHIYLPKSLNFIGLNAFAYCNNLEEVYINSETLEIEMTYGKFNPFDHCSKIVKFVGPLASSDGRCLISDNTLYCLALDGLAEYSIPQGIKEIAGDACVNKEIEKIFFSEGLEMIGMDAFANCRNLKEITFPSTLKNLASYAFRGCTSIEGFYGNEKFHTSDNRCLIAYMEDMPEPMSGKWIILFGGSSITDYTIPEGIVGIENYAFEDKVNLRSVTLPESLVQVSRTAFEGCYNLEAVYGKNTTEDHFCHVKDGKLTAMLINKGIPNEYKIPDNVTVIGYSAFNGCKNIEKITMGDQVVEIGGYAFSWCTDLKSVTLSANLERIGDNWYPGYNPFSGSTNLEEIYCRALVPPEYYDDQIDEYPKLKFYVPESSLELYRNHSGWGFFAKYMVGYNYTDLPQPDYYTSTDYSQDGVSVTLQKASEGNGINIVLLGDGYSDRQIADGTYKRDMEFAYSNLFAEEPYRSYKNLFNVSYVNAVSATEGFEHGNTALSCGFGDGTYVYGNDNKCFAYAQNVVASQKMNETLVVVVLNSDRYAGTCFMYYPGGYSNDYGSGPAVAYFPKGTDESVFAQLLHHEACGHGFAKLADEYSYEYMGEVPAEEVTGTKDQQANWGWWKNVDFTDDKALVRWAKFLSDARYQYDGLGVFEGGLTYWSGVWRPTENSIMRHNYGGFNAPSREAIYHRIHKLAYGEDWEYDYEKFVEYDAKNRKSSAEAAVIASQVLPLEPMKPTHPPVVIPHSWNR